MADLICFYIALLLAGLINILIAWILASIVTCIAPGYFTPVFLILSTLFISVVVINMSREKL